MTPLQEPRLAFWLAVLVAAASACASPRASVPEGWTGYVVQAGDTLGRIAACRGVSVEALSRANGLADPDLLREGAELRVPPRNRCPAPRPGVADARAAAPPTLPLALAPARKAVAVDEEEACPPPEAALRRGRRFVESGTQRYDEADFGAALVRAEAAVEELSPHAGDAAMDELRARAHLLAAMAAAGLDERERARAELQAALALDPGLRLEATSPRIQELMPSAENPRTDTRR